MTAPSLLDELEEVVRLAEKATPGPWETFNGHLIRYCEGELCTSIAEMRSPYRRNVGITRGEEEQRINLKLIVDLVNFIRTNHATLADMAKRMEAAERDAAELRMCKGEYAMPDGTIAKCHVNVGVNVWHGERWLAFHECSPDQLRLIIDAATQEGEG